MSRNYRREFSSKSYVFSTQPFIEMATVLPHGLPVIVGATVGALTACPVRSGATLRPESEVVMPSAMRRNALLNKRWPQLRRGIKHTNRERYADKAYLE